MVEPVLDVQDLSVEYEAGAGTFHALTGVSVRLDRIRKKHIGPRHPAPAA